MAGQSPLWTIAIGATLLIACDDGTRESRGAHDGSVTDAGPAAQDLPGSAADDGDDAGDDVCSCGCVELQRSASNERCEFVYGILTAGDFQDEPSELNVHVGSHRAPWVSAASHCGPTLGGFYVDDANAPTTFTLCPATCEQFRMKGRALIAPSCGEPL